MATTVRSAALLVTPLTGPGRRVGAVWDRQESALVGGAPIGDGVR